MTGDILARLQAAQSDAEREWVVMEWSLANLEPEVREAVWAAAIPHWFDLHYLAALLDQTVDAVRLIHQQLITLSYVEVYPGLGYNVHERTRRLLLDRLWRDNEERFRALSQRAASFCARQDQTNVGWRIETIYQSLLGAVPGGIESFVSQGIFWHNIFAYENIEALVRPILEEAEYGWIDQKAANWALYRSARIHLFQDQTDKAITVLRKAIINDTDQSFRASWFQLMGDINLRRLRFDEAIEEYEIAVVDYQADGDNLGHANCQKALGDVHSWLGSQFEAQGYYLNALSTFEVIDSKLGVAGCLQALGDIQHVLGDKKLAEELYLKALDVYRAIEDRVGESNCLQALGNLSFHSDDYHRALARYEEAFPNSARTSRTSTMLAEQRTLFPMFNVETTTSEDSRRHQIMKIPWLAGVIVVTLISFFSGLLISSYNLPLGVVTFVVLMSLSLMLIPSKYQRLFRTFLTALIIGLTLTLVVIEIVPTGDLHFLFGQAAQPSELVQVLLIVLLPLLSIIVGGVILWFVLLAGVTVIVPWLQAVGGDATITSAELRKYVLRTYFGLSPSYVVVAGGEIVAMSPAGMFSRFGGPGIAIVKPETAVVFEYVGETSAVCGPGVKKDVRMLEKLVSVIDLRPQQGITGQFRATASDATVMQLNVRFRYRIARQGETIGDMITSTSVELTGAPGYLRDTILNATYEAGAEGWHQATVGAVRAAVITEILGWTTGQIFPGEKSEPISPNNAIQTICHRARQHALKLTLAWGVYVSDLSIESISPVEKTVNRIQVTPEAGLTQSQVASYFDLIEKLVHIIKTSSETGVLDYRYVQAVEALSENPNARVIIVPAAQGVLIENVVE